MSRIRDTWTAIKRLPKNLPDLAADRMEQFLIDIHKPIDLGSDEPWVCVRCRKDAPCDELMKAVEARGERLAAGGFRWKR